MTIRKQGLIVVISSAGGLRYLSNVAYGIGKAAVSLSAFFSSIILSMKKNFSVIVWRLIQQSN
jgi:dehydrogenase/reductase SDR family protein 1